jgi:hypothetical protein
MLLCMRVLALLLAAAGLAAAHHSFAAEYDDTKPVKLMGKITKVEWMNPHVWYYVEVKDESGKTTTWALSGGAPGQLQRRGITKDAIVVGATVNVEGFRAKDGSNNAFGSRVVYEDGRSVFTAATDAYDPSTKK